MPCMPCHSKVFGSLYKKMKQVFLRSLFSNDGMVDIYKIYSLLSFYMRVICIYILKVMRNIGNFHFVFVDIMLR